MLTLLVIFAVAGHRQYENDAHDHRYDDQQKESQYHSSRRFKLVPQPADARASASESISFFVFVSVTQTRKSFGLFL